MKIVSLMLPADLKNMDSIKNRHSHHLKKKLPTKFFIHFKICTIKPSVKFNLQTNFLFRKISKETPNFQLATVVLSLELPVRGLVITIQYSNIVTLVTRNLDESLGQSLGKIVRKSMGSDPVQNFFLALRDSFRDSGRDWFPILFFSARVRIVHFTMLALLSEDFGKFCDTRSRITDDLRVNRRLRQRSYASNC